MIKNEVKMVKGTKLKGEEKHVKCGENQKQ